MIDPKVKNPLSENYYNSYYNTNCADIKDKAELLKTIAIV